jgi:rSAM/selenodomain-associated transferase 2
MISVVIPTVNEAENLPKCLDAIRRNGGHCEVLVVDAGSEDRTWEVASRLGAKVINAPVRQRAAQLNLGASLARGGILLFLHADTLVPENAFERIEAILEKEDVGGGAFARRFDSNSLFLKFTCGLAELRNRAIGWHLGDQAMFVRRPIFEKLGGFRPMNRFEDLDFSRRLRRLARIVTLRPPVISSARRFAKEGPVKRTAKDFFLTMAYLRGAPEAATTLPGASGTRLEIAHPAE